MRGKEKNNMIIVEVKNEILGDHEFWRGDEDKISEIKNLVAKNLAKRVSIDGQPRSSGMWFVRKEN